MKRGLPDDVFKKTMIGRACALADALREFVAEVRMEAARELRIYDEIEKLFNDRKKEE